MNYRIELDEVIRLRESNKYWSLVLISLLLLFSFALVSAGTGEVLTAFAQNRPIELRKTIVIDAGHGGEDGGAVSCTGAFESEINLDIALKLNDLMHLLGMKTVMIRTTDCSVYTHGNTLAQKKVSDLKERVRVANSVEDALLISIHQNYFAKSQYKGAQVFYGDGKNSQALADRIQRTFVQSLNEGSKRMVKKAEGVYLMQHIHGEGVLVECGFLSNPEEEALLRSDAYQKKICCILAANCSIFLHGDMGAT